MIKIILKMFETTNLNTVKYKQMFEEAFEGLTNEVENLNLNFENYNGTGYNIKSINECENVNDYKVNLFCILSKNEGKFVVVNKPINKILKLNENII